METRIATDEEIEDRIKRLGVIMMNISPEDEAWILSQVDEETLREECGLMLDQNGKLTRIPKNPESTSTAPKTT